MQDFAILVVDDDAFAVAIGDAFDVRPVAAVGDFLDGEVELVAGDEVDRIRRREGLVRLDGDLGADEPDLGGWIDLLDHLGRLDVGLEGRRGGVEHDQVLAPDVGFDVLEGEIMRRRVDQLRALDHRRRLGQPRRIPERAHLALHLVARAGAAVIAVEGWSLQKE